MSVERDEQRAAILQELQDALDMLNTGEMPPAFVDGHGVQSLVFRFSWSDESLQIDIQLPCSRLLSGEELQETQKDDVGAALRMAILVLKADANEKLLREGEKSIRITCTENGLAYMVLDEEGQVLEEEDDWTLLAARLETSFEEEGEESLVIFWP